MPVANKKPLALRFPVSIAVLNALIRMWIGIKTMWYRRSTLRSLAPLSDQLLNDIGIDTCDIIPLADRLAADYQTRQLARQLISNAHTAPIENDSAQHSNKSPRLNRVRLHARY